MAIPILVFTFILILTETEAKCQDGSHFYLEDNMCIHLYEDVMTWQDAQTSCQEKGGNLVQILNEHKNLFVIDIQEKLSSDKTVWTGLSDIDFDGTFDYANGTKLEIKQAGIGHWGDGAAMPSRHTGKSELCVGIVSKAWKVGKCSNKNYYVCETREESSPVMEEMVKACTLEECNCNKSDWRRDEKRDISYLVNRVAKNFKTSALICDKLGARLVTIPDKATETFLLGMDVSWVPKGVFYWMGLFTMHNEWYWVDGKKQTSKDYSNWYRKSVGNRECGVAIWDYWGMWRPVPCKEQFYHVCEAHDPCSAHPVLSIDGEKQPMNGMVTKMNRRKSEVTCVIKGYVDRVKIIEATCGMDHSSVKASGINTTQIMDIDMNINLHNASCICQLMLDDGVIMTTKFILYLKSPPNLVSKTKIIYKKFGETIIQDCDIYANPRPDTFELMKDGMTMNMSDYNVTIQSLDKPLHYKVTVQMNDTFSYKMIGEYTLAITNELKNGTVGYIFQVKDVSSRHAEFDESFNYVPIAIAILLIVLFILFIVLWLLFHVVKIRASEDVGETEAAIKPGDESLGPEEESTEQEPPPMPTRYGRHQSTVLF